MVVQNTYLTVVIIAKMILENLYIRTSRMQNFQNFQNLYIRTSIHEYSYLKTKSYRNFFLRGIREPLQLPGALQLACRWYSWLSYAAAGPTTPSRRGDTCILARDLRRIWRNRCSSLVGWWSWTLVKITKIMRKPSGPAPKCMYLRT